MSTPEDSPEPPPAAPIPTQLLPIEKQRSVYALFFDRVEGRWVETPLMGISCKDDDGE